jgi:peptide chain release factor subunit 1
VRDTLAALERGACKDIIAFEHLDINRYVLRHPITGEQSEFHFTPAQERVTSNFRDKEDGTELDIVEKMPLLEWLTTHYTEFGATLTFVSDRSQEGAQFVQGFGGLGGLLRYVVDFADMEVALQEDEGAGYDSDDLGYYEDDIDGDFL